MSENMEAKNCGCWSSADEFNCDDCLYPALLAQVEQLQQKLYSAETHRDLIAESAKKLERELAELKHCKECDTSGGYHETFCSKVLWACNHAHNLLNARDVLVPELTAKVEKLEQERDALAGELARFKAFALRHAGPTVCWDEWICSCGAKDESPPHSSRQKFTHAPDCLYIAAGGGR